MTFELSSYYGKSDLSNSNFSDAILEGVYFNDANFDGANFENADLEYSDLDFFKWRQINGNTILPDNISDEQISSLIIPENTSFEGRILVADSGYYFTERGNVVAHTESSDEAQGGGIIVGAGDWYNVEAYNEIDFYADEVSFELMPADGTSLGQTKRSECSQPVICLVNKATLVQKKN